MGAGAAVATAAGGGGGVGKGLEEGEGDGLATVAWDGEGGLVSAIGVAEGRTWAIWCPAEVEGGCAAALLIAPMSSRAANPPTASFQPARVRSPGI